MCHHYAGKAFAKQSLVRIKLNFVDSFFGKIHNWKRVVRICGSIAMAWKMLSGGKNSLILNTFHQSRSPVGDIHFVFSKRTITDNRIFRIGIDIQNRSKVKMNSYSPALQSISFADFFNQFQVLNGSQSHVPRITHYRVQAHCQSPFGVNTYKQRNF